MLCNCLEALRLIPEVEWRRLCPCAGFESVRVFETTLLHFTPPRAYYARNSGLSIVFMDFFRGWKNENLEAARAAHGAVVAGLAAGIDRALLLVFEKLNQFRDGGFLDSKSFLAGMIDQLRAADCGLRTVSLS